MFQLIFKGECLPGVDRETVRANAKALFKASPEQIDKMFSGQPMVIRNQLEQAQAEKYVGVLARHGMKTYAQPMVRVASPTAPQTSGPRVEPGERLNVAGDKVDGILAGSGLSLDPVGVTLAESAIAEAPLFEHLDDWTLAPPGSDLGVKTDQPPPIVPDTSHLSLADDQHEPDDR